MAISNNNIERFMEAQKRAKKLIQMDMNGDLNKYSKQAAAAYESNMYESAQSQEMFLNENVEKPMTIPQNSKLPKEILESFKTKQILIGLLETLLFSSTHVKRFVP